MSVSKWRPDNGGVVGRHIDVLVNLYELDVPKFDGKTFHYDVCVKDDDGDEVRNRTLKRSIIVSMVRNQNAVFTDSHFLSMIYDGEKNLYFGAEVQPISGANRNAELPLRVVAKEDEMSEPSHFVVCLKWASEIDWRQEKMRLQVEGNISQQALQLLVLAVNEGLHRNGELVYTAKAFYDASDLEQKQLCANDAFKMICFGVRPTVRNTNGRLLLNVESTTAVFLRHGIIIGSLYDDQVRQDAHSRSRAFEKLMRIAKNASIYFMKPDQTLHYASVQHILKDWFSNADPKFIQLYKKSAARSFIRNPKNPGFRIRAGKEIWEVPIDLAKLVPQRYMKSLVERDQAALIKEASICAPKRRELITKFRNQMCLERNEVLKFYGITATPNMLTVKARVLEAPELQFNSTSTVRPTEGSWRMPNRATFFRQGDKKDFLMGSPVVINFSQIVQWYEIRKFFSMMQKTAETRGLQMGDLLQERVVSVKEKDVEPRGFPNLLGHVASMIGSASGDGTDRPEFLFAIFDRKTPLYGDFKHFADTVAGTVSQVIMGLSVRKAQKSTIENILLKMNMKLGGSNFMPMRTPSLLGEGCMVVGASLTHPAAGEIRKPTAAAFVANIDPQFQHFRTRTTVLNPREDVAASASQEVSGAFRYFIEQWRERNGNYPTKLIFFREGVSGDRAQELLQNELKAIGSGVKQTGMAKPQFAFIVIHKRHSIKLFVSNDKDACGRMNNCPPGTVVDCSPVVEPRKRFDFFLLSHAGIQGTARASHYEVINNAFHSQYNSDDFQEATLFLCHLYQRCTRAVSLPAHVFYSHLAAFRTSLYLQDVVYKGKKRPERSNIHGRRPKVEMEYSEIKDFIQAHQNHDGFIFYA